MTKKPFWAYYLSMLIFLGFIIIAYAINVKDYVNDSLLMMALLSILFFNYELLKLKPWTYLVITFAFAFHNLGVFGYYDVSPLFLQWDHITHLFGEFAAALFVYNYIYESGFFKNKNKKEIFVALSMIVLIVLGIGVLVEFLEFFGYFIVGEGLGILGHGAGDINTEFINNECFNTMFDFIYNTIGAVIGTLFMRYGLKKK